MAMESADGKTLYYIKSFADDSGPLFKKSLSGGPEEQVLDPVWMRGFAVFENGIYYLSRKDEQNVQIRFLAFATGQSRVIGELEGSMSLGLS